MRPTIAVPPDDAPWEAVFDFALTYDGYKHHGSEGAFAVSRSLYDQWRRTRDLPDDLAAIRCALFIEQRSAHWTEFNPEHDGPWVSTLVAKIRELTGGTVVAPED
jgi:hypothetical protein